MHAIFISLDLVAFPTTVRYDDGDVEWLNLELEQIVVEGGALPSRNKLRRKSGLSRSNVILTDDENEQPTAPSDRSDSDFMPGKGGVCR